MLNVSETVRDTDIGTMKYGLTHDWLKGAVSNDLEWVWLSKIFNNTKHAQLSFFNCYLFYTARITCNVWLLKAKVVDKKQAVRNMNPLAEKCVKTVRCVFSHTARWSCISPVHSLLFTWMIWLCVWIYYVDCVDACLVYADEWVVFHSVQCYRYTV